MNEKIDVDTFLAKTCLDFAEEFQSDFHSSELPSQTNPKEKNLSKVNGNSYSDFTPAFHGGNVLSSPLNQADSGELQPSSRLH